MKAQRIFSVLILTGLMIIAAVNASAQTGGAAELKKRIFAEIAAGNRARAAEPVIELESQADAQRTTQSVGQLAKVPKKSALIGTWDVTLTFGDGSQVRSTLQVLPGAAEGEGSILHASEFSFTLPNPTLPEQGTWQHVSGTQFIASYSGYAYTEQFAPFGKIGFRHSINVGGDQESFTGRAVFEVIDGTGQVLFSDNVQTRGVRQHPVAHSHALVGKL